MKTRSIFFTVFFCLCFLSNDIASKTFLFTKAALMTMQPRQLLAKKNSLERKKFAIDYDSLETKKLAEQMLQEALLSPNDPQISAQLAELKRLREEFEEEKKLWRERMGKMEGFPVPARDVGSRDELEEEWEKLRFEREAFEAERAAAGGLMLPPGEKGEAGEEELMEPPAGELMEPPAERERKKRRPAKKIVEKESVIPEALTDDQLLALSEIDRKKSDALVLEIVNKVSAIVDSSFKQLSPSIENVLLLLRENENFKNRKKYDDTFASSKTDRGLKKNSKFMAFIKDNVEDRAKENLFNFLEQMYLQAMSDQRPFFDQVKGMFVDLLFDETRSSELAHATDSITVNILASFHESKKENDLLDAQRNKSDRILLINFLDWAEKEGDIPSLVKRLNYLRIKPDFFKENALITRSDDTAKESEDPDQPKGPKVGGEADVINKIMHPARNWTFEKFIVSLRAIFFDFNRFFMRAFLEVGENREILLKAFEEYMENIEKKREPENISPRLEKIKNIAYLRNLLKRQESEIAKETEALLGSMVDTNIPTIISKLKILAGSSDGNFPWEQHIIDLIKDGWRIERVKVPVQQAIQAEWEKKPAERSGKEIYKKLLEIPELVPQVKEVFEDLYRTALTVAKFLVRLLTQEQRMIIQKEFWFETIEPYGELVRIIRDLEKDEEIFRKGFKRLILQNIIDSLNSGEIVAMARGYVAKITGEEPKGLDLQIVTSGAYKNKLGVFSEATKHNNVQEMLKSFDDLVKNAGVGVENKPEYKKIRNDLTHMVVEDIFQEIILELKSLDIGKIVLTGEIITGKAIIPGLQEEQGLLWNIEALREQAREQLKGKFTPIFQLISEAVNDISQVDLSDAGPIALSAKQAGDQFEAAISGMDVNELRLREQEEIQKKDIIKSVRDYLDDMLVRLKNAKQSGLVN